MFLGWVSFVMTLKDWLLELKNMPTVKNVAGCILERIEFVPAGLLCCLLLFAERMLWVI
jgi:hypothetical protein